MERGRGGGVAWRQSLGAGLLLGLALGCAWLAHWTPLFYTRILLVLMAALLTLLGVGLMLSLAENKRWASSWQRGLEARFAAAGLPFFSALLILGLAAITSGNNLLYLIVSGLLAALVVSGLAAALNLSGMVLRFRLPPEIFAGVPVPVEFTLTNAKSLWPAYSLTVSAASRQAPPAGAKAAAGIEAEMRPVYFAYLRRRASVAASSQIQFPRRGRYTTASFLLTTRFPFGLLNQRRRFQASHEEPQMLVYPAPRLPPPLAWAAAMAGAQAQRVARGDGADLYRIREHRPGDGARQVHWKISARLGELRVREFSEENATRLRLRLALAPGLEAAEAEAAIARCAGWLLRLLEPGAAGEIWLEFIGENAPGLLLPLAPARAQRNQILEYLALADPAALTLPHLPAAPLFEIAVRNGQAAAEVLETAPLPN